MAEAYETTRSAASRARGPPGKVRPFWRGLLLAGLTLGLYSLWWHYKTHAEVTRYHGWPNRLKWLWAVYVVIMVVVIALAAHAALDADSAPGPAAQRTDDGSGPQEMPLDDPESMVTRISTPWHGLGPLDTLRAVAFGLYVTGQYVVLYAGLRERGHALGGAALFLGACVFSYLLLTFGSVPLTVVALAAVVFAYAHLQDAYNDLWKDVLGVAEPGAAPGPTDAPARKPTVGS